MRLLLPLVCASLVLAITLLTTTTRAMHLGVPHSPQGQPFIIDADTGQGVANGMTGYEPALPFPALPALPPGEVLVPAAPFALTHSWLVPPGHRLDATTATYEDPAFIVAGDGAILDGTPVGGLTQSIDIGCDGVADVLADALNVPPIAFFPRPIAEPLVEVTTAWGPGTGIVGRDESYLTSVLPPFPRVVRYRATVDTYFIGGAVPLPLVDPVPFNLAVEALPWGPGARVTLLDVGGDPVAPSTQLLCIDSGRATEVVLGGPAGLFNPLVPGLYARWTTMLSNPGTVDETVQDFVYTTSCKRIGGPVPDLDNDCLPDALEGAVCPTGIAVPDTDADGLLDGIETTWGSSPCMPDTDGDGRTDTEEMVGPSAFLTNPLVPDTDADGIVDAGLNLDCDGGGVPDGGVIIEAGPPASGRNRVRMPVVYCGAVAGIGGRPFGNPPMAVVDNCPNIANPGQANTANLDQPNGNIVGAADVTQPNGRFNGDACDNDRDNDGVPDTVELGLAGAGYFFDPAGAPPPDLCNTAGPVGPIVIGDADGDLLVTVDDFDSDNDTTIDGNECLLGSDPDDILSRNLAVPPPVQGDYFRARALVLGVGILDNDFDQDAALALAQLGGPGDWSTDADGSGPLIGPVDGNGQPTCGALVLPQSLVGDGVPYRGEVAHMLAGAPGTPDFDRDSCADVVELLDINGDRVAAGGDKLQVDRMIALFGPFFPAPAPLEIRTADVNGDGFVNGSDALTYARLLAGRFGPYNLNCTAVAIGFPPT